MTDQDQGDPSDRQYPTGDHPFESRDEEIVQVVYRSDQHGSLVGVESTSLIGCDAEGDLRQVAGTELALDSSNCAGQHAINLATACNAASNTESIASLASGIHHEQLSRAASTLPSVAEESTSSGPQADLNGYEVPGAISAEAAPADGAAPAVLSSTDEGQLDGAQFDRPPTGQAQEHEAAAAPVYSTVTRQFDGHDCTQQPIYENQPQQGVPYETLYSRPLQQRQQEQEERQLGPDCGQELGAAGHLEESRTSYRAEGEHDGGTDLVEASGQNETFTNILSRQRAGAVEKGSFRNNFRKKLGVSVSTNENDLTAHRRKFLDSSGEPGQQQQQQQQQHQLQVQRLQSSELGAELSGGPADGEPEHPGSLSNKFKRNHSVSFSVESARSNRHSVDIRNLPSYLTHKRASIVDVAKGAMSSLISSLGGGSGVTSASGSAISGGGHRRDSHQDEEPIFEEPIAPTLSLGQRVAMVRNSGAEFGTVGWIGQLPGVDDDWIVGVIFDNMIGDCDGAHNGVRYFYARANYAMFVPLATLTKTDNYIGRPETGTMLSRMSVSLKPGQLISIQRSSIRLQHCFLNAPHQRVGHDVRAVSNRLHCQCHNCGPCAHLTKQGRINALPQFGAHHLPHRKKNSLAHAAVEMLAHHHHHFHEEEEDHEEKDYEFGDNSAHACNFVRYSCCQQSGKAGHEFSSDCGMVRPELLDNLIHAPKAPVRRSRPRRAPRRSRDSAKPQLMLEAGPRRAPITGGDALATSTLGPEASNPAESLELASAPKADGGGSAAPGEADDDSSYLSTSYSSSSSSSSRASSPARARPAPYNYYTYDTSSFRPTTGVYSTIDSQISFMDQQRYVYRRESAAFLQSPKPSNWSDDYEASSASSVISRDPLGFKRILRCLGCMRQRAATRRRPARRKLSFKDKVLEYRRRQSTFVPSTLAKPHEDFASHGIILPGSSAEDQRQHYGRPRIESGRQRAATGENNSDYSSCSRSSCSSSRSGSPANYGPGQQVADPADRRPYSDQQVASVTLEHELPAANNQPLKSSGQLNRQAEAGETYRPRLDYGDFSYGDGDVGGASSKNKSSGDSALDDFAYTDNTRKSNSSSDTLKYLVDQSVNELVSPLEPLTCGLGEELVSPLSSTTADCEANSPSGGQFEISSPTASLAENGEPEESEEVARKALEEFTMGPDDGREQ